MENKVKAKYERESRFTIFEMYWKTLRLNNQSPGLIKGFKRGQRLYALLTTRCNLHCSYCPMFVHSEKYPKYEECTIDEWKKWLELYPDWISELVISGGEPTIIPWISEFVNWAVERGHHVMILSNLLKPENLLGIKRHWRFVLAPTFHDSDDPERFTKAYKMLEGRFRIVPQELGTKKLLGFTRLKGLFDMDWFLVKNTIYHVAPDGPRTKRIYLGSVPSYRDGQL